MAELHSHYGLTEPIHDPTTCTHCYVISKSSSVPQPATSDYPAVVLSEAERDAIEVLATYTVEPGTRCPTCHRRVNKKQKANSPEAKEVRFRGTEDLVESVKDKVDLLQEYSGADPYSYPALRIVEAALVVAAQQREEFKRYFQGEA